MESAESLRRGPGGRFQQTLPSAERPASATDTDTQRILPLILLAFVFYEKKRAFRVCSRSVTTDLEPKQLQIGRTPFFFTGAELFVSPLKHL